MLAAEREPIMPKKTTATIALEGTTGRLVVKRSTGQELNVKPSKKSVSIVSLSIRSNRDALKRLANR